MKSDVKMCVDMRLPTWMRVLATAQALGESHTNASRAAMPTRVLWSPGRILRCRFLDGHPTIQSRVQQMAMEWTEHANISFLFGVDPDAEIRISFTREGSWSFLGTDCLAVPANLPTMNFGWLTQDAADVEYARVVKHEFGHAIGLIHEHQNPDAAVPWDKPAVYREYEAYGWSRSEIDANLFERYAESSTQFSTYDRASIMHYAIDNKLTIGDYEVGWNTSLSPTDKAFVALVYPRAVKAIDMRVGETRAAKIGEHGQTDVYRFAVAQRGDYRLTTHGSTDLTLSLFRASVLVAEDDDSGYGANARIISTLQPGVYYAHVRHRQPAGTGVYRLSLRSVPTTELDAFE